MQIGGSRDGQFPLSVLAGCWGLLGHPVIIAAAFLACPAGVGICALACCGEQLGCVQLTRWLEAETWKCLDINPKVDFLKWCTFYLS